VIRPPRYIDLGRLLVLGLPLPWLGGAFRWHRTAPARLSGDAAAVGNPAVRMQAGAVFYHGPGSDARMAADMDPVADDRSVAHMDAVTDDRAFTHLHLAVDPAAVAYA
jgi:hypothetical protein